MASLSDNLKRLLFAEPTSPYFCAAFAHNNHINAFVEARSTFSQATHLKLAGRNGVSIAIMKLAVPIAKSDPIFYVKIISRHNSAPSYLTGETSLRTWRSNRSVVRSV